MTLPKTKFPIESFGPELMQALVRGGREKFIIPFPGAEGAGKRKAHKFQQRIHMLRGRMRNEKHPDYPLAARVRVSLFWGDKAVAQGAPKEWTGDDAGNLGAFIVIRPQDSEFADDLAKALAARPTEEPDISGEAPTNIFSPVTGPGELPAPPISRPATVDDLIAELDKEE